MQDYIVQEGGNGSLNKKNNRVSMREVDGLKMHLLGKIESTS